MNAYCRLGFFLYAGVLGHVDGLRGKSKAGAALGYDVHDA